VDLLREDLPLCRVQAVKAAPGTFSAVFTAAGAKPHRSPAAWPELKPQGYAVRLAPDRVEVRAADAAGLWYGLHTLTQLAMLGEGVLPTGEILDWPAIPFRGIHVDLKGCQPKFEQLEHICRLLATHRVNAILLEVEDKFAYVCAPEAGVPTAYSAAQFRRLGELCAALGIQVIPKLQCLGHADYLLKHERYRALRENGHPYQYCPRNEDGMKLWRGMAGELMDCFPGHAFFHIGGDETGNLGECEVCRGYSKAESYVHRVQQCIDVVRRAGRQAMMWEDILRNLHGHLKPGDLEKTWTLGRHAILMYWAYGYGGQNNTFPFLAPYLEQGMKVWGASGYSGCGPSWIQNVPPLAERALNLAAWTKTAIEHRLQGVVATGWTRIASADPPAEMIDACWFPILYAAESMWTGRERHLDAFVSAASRALFGCETPCAGFLKSMNAADLPREDAPFAVRREAARFELLRAAARYAAHENARRNLADALHIYHGRLGGAMPDYRIGMLRGRLQAFRGSLDQCRGDYEKALAALYEAGTVQDVITSRFGRDAALAEEAEALLARTRPV
jgi:hypothetical protein